MLTVRWNALRPIHSSPSSGTPAGRPSMNQSGAWNRLPWRERNCLPSQYARTPSSFSLIHQPDRSAALSQVSASSSGGPASSASSPSAPTVFRAGFCGSAPPSRASSAASPRSLRRCLQVRRSIAVDWFRHAGQVHE